MDSLIPVVEAAQRGDTKAFEALMERFQDRAFAVALAQLGDRHQAEDAVQEAFVEAHLRLGHLQVPSAFPAWLNKIVLGKCVRVIRPGKSVPAPLPLDLLVDIKSPAPDPEAALLQRSASETLRTALYRLSDQEREAFVLFAVGGYKYAEIAKNMDLPLSVVRKRIYTARQQLRNVEALASLRPSPRPEFRRGVALRMTARQQQILQRETRMSKVFAAGNVDLIGPGIESRITVRNLYSFYRYEMLMTQHYPDSAGGGITPPLDVNDETWHEGAWVNQQGVINGLHSATHDEAVTGEDVFWKWPNLQAYLIRLNGWPAGFACVASPPNATKSVDYRLQEFFVLNKARRLGVGSTAVRQLFDRLPGRWELSYNPDNSHATAFWRKVIPELTAGDFEEEMIGMGDAPDLPGYVFTRGPRPKHPIRAR